MPREPLKILICSSEISPFAKTGGLADVAGSLPGALAELGHEVRLMMPKYSQIETKKNGLKTVMPELGVQFFPRNYTGAILQGKLPGSDIPIYFVKHSKFFERETLYGDGSGDYPDNHLRFGFFCMSCIWFLKGLKWSPDILICNDWQTALMPVYLKTWGNLQNDPFYKKIKTLFSIHNLAYQGLFDPEAVDDIGISDSLMTIKGMEFYGKLNLMKGGMLFSEQVSTVSQRYAKEIQTKEFGCGLEGVLRNLDKPVHGIMNGVDYSTWNPVSDKLITANYSAKDLSGKAQCKQALQKNLGLAINDSIPIIGVITRLDAQKGLDLIQKAEKKLAQLNCQFVLVGTGDPKYEKLLRDLAKRHPDKILASIKFDEKLAHQIIAGSDMLLVPSRYEPCGLTQLYAMHYGTIPVVRETGGLADSVTPHNAKTGGTGFLFKQYKPDAMVKSIQSAINVYNKKPGDWQCLIQNAMTADFSWTAAAKNYEDLFYDMCAS